MGLFGNGDEQENPRDKRDPQRKKVDKRKENVEKIIKDPPPDKR